VLDVQLLGGVSREDDAAGAGVEKCFDVEGAAGGGEDSAGRLATDDDVHPRLIQGSGLNALDILCQGDRPQAQGQNQSDPKTALAVNHGGIIPVTPVGSLRMCKLFQFS